MTALPLTPVVHSAVRAFLDDVPFVRDLLDACGSPLNVVFPSILRENVGAFESIFRTHCVRGRTHFACKANKSRAIVAQACQGGIGIDVASAGELKKALGRGFTGERIEATGPKNDAFLALALRQGCLISVDGVAELASIARLRQRIGPSNPTRILLRLSGFRAEGSSPKDSRFGIPWERRRDAYNFLDAHRSAFDVRGVAFHLDTAAMKEKVAAVERCLDALDELIDGGWNPTILNIGGGFRTNYLADPDEWHAYVAALQAGVLGKREPLGWNGAGFGYRADGGTLRGGPAFYEYLVPTSGPAYLDELLSSELPGRGTTVGGHLSDAMVELLIEPGRALLDQAGVTVARVLGRKETASGQTLVGLDMNRSNLASLDQEMFVDPVLLPAGGERTTDAKGVFFVGNLCLENDFVYRHRTFLPFLPEPGDLAVFVNTAGYNGDFEESASLEQSVARKVAVVREGNRHRWFLDECYDPFLISA